MRKPPSDVAATPVGERSCADVAGWPSPVYPQTDVGGLPVGGVPATVVIRPAAETFRMMQFATSAISQLPSAYVDALLMLRLISADVAGPPSPLYPQVPVPAPSLIVPLAETFRTRQLPNESGMT